MYKCFNVAKWLILFQDTMTSLSLQNVSRIDRDTFQGHDNKIPRPSTSFIIIRTQLKFKSHWFLRIQISTLCQEKWTFHTSLTFLVSKVGLSTHVDQPGFILREKLRNFVMKCKIFFWLLDTFSQNNAFWDYATFSCQILIQSTQFYQWQLEYTRFMFFIKYLQPLCNYCYNNWNSVFFHIHGNYCYGNKFFNTIMQLIDPNYSWKNGVKQIKVN